MKTAISLPDELFECADALAHRLGVSRSELYATAVAEFLAKHQDAKVTERFSRLSAGEILYSFTVEDPAIYTLPWRGG